MMQLHPSVYESILEKVYELAVVIEMAELSLPSTSQRASETEESPIVSLLSNSLKPLRLL